MLKQIWSNIRSQVFLLSSSLAFTSVLSFAPLFAFIYFIFDIFGSLENLQSELNRFIISNLAPSFGDQVMDLVGAARLQINSKALGVFGILGFTYAVTSMLTKIEDFFNLIWQRRARRSYLKRSMIYLTIIVIGPLLLGLSFYVSSQVAGWLKHDNGEISRAILFWWTLVPYLFTSFLFIAMYLLLPAGQVNRKYAVLSGLGAGLAFELAKVGYSTYARYSLENSVYGSLAILPVFLIWLNLGWVIVLSGAIVCCYYDKKASI